MGVDVTKFPFEIARVKDKIRTSSMPYLYDIAKGNVPNHYALHKFGYNGTVPATEETIWEQSSVYAYLAAATTLKISSSDVDDAVAGDGAQNVDIYGLDANYNEISEIVNLNGQTEVNTVRSYLRIFRMMVTRAGATGSNEGTLYAGTGAVTSGVPAVVYASVPTGHNQSLMAMWTVPAGHTAYLVHLFASTGISNKTTEIFLYVRPYGEVFQVKKRYHILAGIVDRQFLLPLELKARSDIEIRGTAAGGGGAISASFDLWYEKE